MFNLKAEELDNKDPTNNGNIYILVFEEEIVGEGDQRLAVDPFKGEIHAPSGFKSSPHDSEPPN